MGAGGAVGRGDDVIAVLLVLRDSAAEFLPQLGVLDHKRDKRRVGLRSGDVVGVRAHCVILIWNQLESDWSQQKAVSLAR